MGWYKEQMIIEQERGYLSAPEKFVCSDMFIGYQYIRDYINNNAVEGVCSYCGAKSSVCSLQSIVKLVFEEFEEYFENPANMLVYESKGIWDDLEGTGLHKECGGYIIPNNRTIFSTVNALHYCGFILESTELFNDISDCFYNNAWVLKDTYSPTDEERMIDNWEEFWNNTIMEFQNGKSYDIIRNNNAYLLKHISEEIGSNIYALKTEIKCGQSIFRCVNYKEVPYPLEGANLWAPPADKASSQRMSKEGQSRLYASFDDKTPIQEAVSNNPNEYHCLGEFRLKKTIHVLDFTELPEASLLNVPNFITYRFFHKFADAITQVVHDNEKEKYIPTQLMRDIIEEDHSRKGILGIKYKSVKGEYTDNVVLFLDDKTCPDYLELVNSVVIEPNK